MRMAYHYLLRVVLYIHNAVYGHFFFCWAFFKRALSFPVVLSTTPFVWWWYGELVFSIMFELWNSLLNLSLVYCEQRSVMTVVDNPYFFGTWVNCSQTVVADVSGSVMNTGNLK